MFREWTADIEKARINLGIQGMSVGVVHKGKIIYAQGFGKRNDKDPFTPETLSHIASTTKAFTAAAVGELVAEKKARWDVPVNEYLPEFKLKDPRLTAEVNFIDLLAHRTGYPSLDLDWYHRPESRPELIKQLRNVDPEVPFRSAFVYNNIMYAVAGEAAARIAGTSYERLVLDKVLRPVGMTSSGLSLAEMISRPNHALPYVSKSFEAAQKGEVFRATPDTLYMTDAPAGDIYANIIDLSRWARAIMNNGQLDGKQVLAKETVQTITTPWNIEQDFSRHDPASTAAYGLGWAIESYKGHRVVQHGGANPGYRTSLVLFPDDDLAIVCLSNNNINNLVDEIPYYIVDRFFNLPTTTDWLFDVAVTTTKRTYKYIGEDATQRELFFPPQIKDKPASRNLKEFAGEYTHPYGMKLTVKVVEGRGKKAPTLAYKFVDFEGTLDHYHYDSFRIRVVQDYYKISVLVTFVSGPDGSIQEARVLMDEDSTKVFIKS
ncbi:hypothetical protein DFQ26_003692 [Actinomortierella ambigua]|nr:hypothetical protein DFQ26_003692 [Actinomortierella ambigua]